MPSTFKVHPLLLGVEMSNTWLLVWDIAICGVSVSDKLLGDKFSNSDVSKNQFLFIMSSLSTSAH